MGLPGRSRERRADGGRGDGSHQLQHSVTVVQHRLRGCISLGTATTGEDYPFAEGMCCAGSGVVEPNGSRMPGDEWTKRGNDTS